MGVFSCFRRVGVKMRMCDELSVDNVFMPKKSCTTFIFQKKNK